MSHKPLGVDVEGTEMTLDEETMDYTTSPQEFYHVYLQEMHKRLSRPHWKFESTLTRVAY